VTVDGTWATDVLPLVRDTVAPLGGAARVSVTVPVDDLHTGTVVGFNVSDVNEATDTVRVAVELEYTS
jgi:hypothetical protein